MGLHRLDADAETQGYSLVVVSLAHELHNFPLARRQRGAGIFLLGLGTAHKALEQHLRDLRAEERLMGSERLDSKDHVTRCIGFQKITAGPRCENLAHQFFRFVHRKDQYLYPGYCSHDLPRRFDPIQVRHGEVDDRDVRDKLLCYGDGCAACRSLATNLPAGVFLEQKTQAAANDVMIVGDENAEHVPALEREAPPEGNEGRGKVKVWMSANSVGTGRFQDGAARRYCLSPCNFRMAAATCRQM